MRLRQRRIVHPTVLISQVPSLCPVIDLEVAWLLEAAMHFAVFEAST